MPRPRCSVFIATSLDGFIARSDGRIDWLGVVERQGEDYGFKEFFDSVDTIVMGRKTYETALAFDAWPFAGKRCVVLTHALRPSRQGEEFYRGELKNLVERLLAEGAEHVYVDGGSVLSQFLALGLIDDLTVAVIPVLLGDGVRLTQGLGRDVRLRFVRSRSFDSGLVQLEYAVVPRSGEAAS
jgi:dihydrofolate reductase